MTIVMTDPKLDTIDDVLLAYINHLRFQHNLDQHMLQSRSIDEKLLKQRDDTRAKNTDLEQENRRLRTELQRAHELLAQFINERNTQKMGEAPKLDDDPDHRTFRRAPK